MAGAAPFDMVLGVRGSASLGPSVTIVVWLAVGDNAKKSSSEGGRVWCG